MESVANATAIDQQTGKQLNYGQIIQVWIFKYICTQCFQLLHINSSRFVAGKRPKDPSQADLIKLDKEVIYWIIFLNKY